MDCGLGIWDFGLIEWKDSILEGGSGIWDRKELGSRNAECGIEKNWEWGIWDVGLFRFRIWDCGFRIFMRKTSDF